MRYGNCSLRWRQRFGSVLIIGDSRARELATLLICDHSTQRDARLLQHMQVQRAQIGFDWSGAPFQQLSFIDLHNPKGFQAWKASNYSLDTPCIRDLLRHLANWKFDVLVVAPSYSHVGADPDRRQAYFTALGGIISHAARRKWAKAFMIADAGKHNHSRVVSKAVLSELTEAEGKSLLQDCPLDHSEEFFVVQEASWDTLRLVPQIVNHSTCANGPSYFKDHGWSGDLPRIRRVLSGMRHPVPLVVWEAAHAFVNRSDLHVRTAPTPRGLTSDCSHVRHCWRALQPTTTTFIHAMEVLWNQTRVPAPNARVPDPGRAVGADAVAETQEAGARGRSAGGGGQG